MTSIVSSMEPLVDDLVDDLESLSFNSTTTNTKRSSTTSSASEATATHFTTSFLPSSSSTSSSYSSSNKPHAPTSDPCLEAIQRLRKKNTTGNGAGVPVSIADFRFIYRLGSGDIGSVYLVEVKGEESNGCVFAAKLMDKKELASRNKESRARVEREILEMLDHPFLPTLYAALDSTRWSCLLTEFCTGGDLHVLRQRQPGKRFHEAAVR